MRAWGRAAGTAELPWGGSGFEDKNPQSTEKSAVKKRLIHSLYPWQEIKSMCYSKEARLDTGEKALSH